MSPKEMCGRCYAETYELFDANCEEKPEYLIGAPIGMYHCPDCGALIMAGLPHPRLCELCLDRKHPDFDKQKEEEDEYNKDGSV